MLLGSPFTIACSTCDIKTIESMIENGVADVNQGLLHACYRGHINIVNFLIEKGATNWNSGLFWACISGHMTTVQLMIEKGATDWDRGLEGACYGDHIEIVKLMIEKGATDWNSGLCNAAYRGQVNIAKLMIEKGATNVKIISVDYIKKLLNLGIDTKLIRRHKEFKQIISSRKTRIKGITKIADEVLYELYKTKQIYDINVISIITEYTEY